MSIALHIMIESKSSITFGWEPPDGVEYYLFYAGGKRVSNAPAVDRNGNPKTTIRFSKIPSPWEVVAITRQEGVMGTEVGYYPPKLPSSEGYSEEAYSSGAYSH
jgi:hypothetical protein